MQVLTATLRHRELTQEIFNIGDEVATFIENIAEAIADWDVELVEDCVAEFEDIINDARNDSRTIVKELIGLRHALTSGLASGTVGIPMPMVEEATERPAAVNAQSLRNQFPIPINAPVTVQEINQSLKNRTDLVRQYLACIVDWELAETEKAAYDIDSRRLSILFARTADAVTGATKAWLEAVVADYPGVARTMRGSHPPEFLNERARIDAVVARVKAKMGRAAGAHVS
ncbi:MAG: hypothetical protein Q4A82_01910 [Corynebacterium sp.]|nr:hypothetical protein [Corynebacterium sp.]